MASITDWLDYTPRGTGARTRGYRVQVTPNSGSSANPADTVRFDIPCGRGRGSFIDPSQTYIMMQVKSTDAAAMNLDGSAYAFLNRFSLFSSGQVLEDISDYGHAVSTYLDLQCLGVDLGNGGSVMLGTNNAVANNTDKTGTNIPIGSGTNQYLDVCLPLHLSGLLGTSCPKLLPVGVLQDLRAEFMIETAAQAVVCTSGTPAWTLQNIVLNLFYVDVDPSVAEQVYSQNGGVYKISTEGFRTYQTITAANRSADSILIPARFSSMKSIISTYRDNAQRNSSAAYWVAHRVNPFYDSAAGNGRKCSIQYQIGSMLFPNTPIVYGASELYANMLQSFHSMGNIAMNNRANYLNWIQPAHNTTATSMGQHREPLLQVQVLHDRYKHPDCAYCTERLLARVRHHRSCCDLYCPL
jgi:hypothetical protein